MKPTELLITGKDSQTETANNSFREVFSRKWVIAILLIVIVLLSTFLDDFVAPLGIPIVVAMIFVLYLVQKRPIKNLGVFIPENWTKTLLLGFGGGIFIFLFGLNILSPVLQYLGISQVNPEFYEQIKGNRAMLIPYLIVSWTTAAFGEEIIYRGYFLDQFTRFIPNTKSKWFIALLISSVAFGALHYNNGLDSMIVTGINGFIIGVVYLLNKRNIWGAFIAHGVANTIAFLAIYWGLG